MLQATTAQPVTLAAPALLVGDRESRWLQVCQRFLEAVAANQYEATERLLHDLHSGGAGLRQWVSSIAYRDSILPEQLPVELIEVYLRDAEAYPLHDCEDCGVSVPVRPSRLYGMEGEPEQVYFPTCPCCGGRTGWYAYWSRIAESAPDGSVRRRRPR
jgi:hypothetical protein